MSLLSFSNGSIYKKVLLLILISLLISGCRHEKNKDIDLYNLNKDTTIEHYLPLSEYGEDYMIPDLSSKKWSKWNIYNDECKKKISNESKIYILRNIHLSDQYGNYEIKLKTDDINKKLKKEIKKYIGQIKESNHNVSNINDINFYDSKGTVDDSEYQYRSISFQSKCVIPSVSIQYVPTMYIVLYKGGDEQVNHMLEELKEWMIYIY